MSQRGSQTLRIIGGQWRGRKFAFPNAPHLRPTPDRVRETLFNWLMPYTDGARCLDLFSGSGALGLEALSRGAASVIFVDENRHVIDHLKQTCQTLQTEQAGFFTGDARQFLRQSAQHFDLVFLDPPYDLDLLTPVCMSLAQQDWLAPHAHVYVEHDGRHAPENLPENWQEHRSKIAGQVHYALYKVTD